MTTLASNIAAKLLQVFKNPLSSWLIAAILFTTLPLLQHINGGLLSAGTIANQSEKRPRVLLITGSGLHCALKNGDNSDQQLIADINSVYLPLASIWSFDDIGRTIEKANPDIVILQGSVLANNSKPSSSRVWLRQLKRYWIVNLSTIHPQLERLLTNLQCKHETLDREKWNSWLDTGVSDKVLNTVNIPQQAEFLNKLIDYKKPIIIVNQPHPPMATRFNSTVFKSIDHIVRSVDTNNSITKFNYTSAHPESSFYDPFHPKPELSTIFTGWFHDELSRLIRE